MIIPRRANQGELGFRLLCRARTYFIKKMADIHPSQAYNFRRSHGRTYSRHLVETFVVIHFQECHREAAMIHVAPARFARSAAALFILFLTSYLLGQEKQKAPTNYPTAEAVAEMLSQEPMTMLNWPVWRTRLWDWLDDRSEATTPAFIEAWSFMMRQADLNGELPPPLAKDAFAWYLLGSGYLHEASSEHPPQPAHWARAEKAMRQSLTLNPNSGRAHARLAQILIRQRDPRSSDQTKLDEAARQLAEARSLEPSLPFLP
ncbi:MAG TPA: hypothetical protein VGX70_09410, partial [Gemmataceae bacterium]|nr:hypothetical protein [Gemmataceae bacterium]